MSRTVSYKRVHELRAKDQVVFPDTTVKTVVGKIKRDDKFYVTFLGGIERAFDMNHLMQLANISGDKLPGYFKSYGMK